MFGFEFTKNNLDKKSGHFFADMFFIRINSQLIYTLSEIIINKPIPNKIKSNKIREKPRIVFLIRMERRAKINDKINKKNKEIPTMESCAEELFLPNGSNVNLAQRRITGIIRNKKTSENAA